MLSQGHEEKIVTIVMMILFVLTQERHKASEKNCNLVAVYLIVHLNNRGSVYLIVRFPNRRSVYLIVPNYKFCNSSD